MNTVPWSSGTEAVLTIEPASDADRASHPLATLALVEHYLGQAQVLTTDDQCPNGIRAAACAWAQSTNAVFCGREAS